MNDYLENNSSEMLHQLLDGELEPVKESSIFNQLAGNEELRGEFKEFIKIRDSIKFDSEAFTPPPDATNSLFKKIGFSIPFRDAGSEIMSEGGKSAFLATAIKRFWLPAAAAIIASLFTAGVIINHYDGKLESLQNEVSNAKNLLDDYKAQSDKIEQDKSNIASQPKQIEVPKYIYIYKKDKDLTKNNENIAQNNNQNLPNTEIPQTRHDLSLLSFAPIANNGSGNDYLMNRQFGFSTSIPNFATAPQFPVSIEKNGLFKNFGFEVRGINATSSPFVDLNQNNNALFNGMAFNFYYKYENSKLGLEGGYEYFGQIFNNNIGGYDIINEQNPLLFWLGVMYRYDFNQLAIFENLHPYSQLTIGGTQIGPVGKAIMGLSLSTQSGFGLNLGIEGSLLYYKNQGNSYFTKKIGLTYGISYNF